MQNIELVIFSLVAYFTVSPDFRPKSEDEMEYKSHSSQRGLKSISRQAM